MEKVNKTNYKISAIKQQVIEGVTQGIERANKKMLKEIDEMSKSPEWEEFVKRANSNRHNVQ